MPFWVVLAKPMSKLFSAFNKGKSRNASDTGATEASFQKASTGGLMSKATFLVNETDETLYLRDKVGAAYGGTRYKILGKSSIEVTPLQHTFFKMIAYAVEEDKSEGEGSSNTNKKKTSTDTNLTIDSDQLNDNKRITIKKVDGKFQIEFSSR